MVRRRAISAFTRVLDALWRAVSNHVAPNSIIAASWFETRSLSLAPHHEGWE
jgi:hypothetical protein